MKTGHLKKISRKKKILVKAAVMLFAFAIGMLLSIFAMAQSNNKPGNFYAVTGNGLNDTSWIFGTYHLVNSSYLQEVPAVSAAFKKAGGVVVEIMMDSTSVQSVAAMGILKDKTLATLLDKSFSDSLDQELKQTLGVGLEQVNQLKPMNVLLTLSIVHLMKDAPRLQQYTGEPLDAFFAAEARHNGKFTTALETIEEQMNILFSSMSNEEQVGLLKMFLRNKAKVIQEGNELLQGWFEHDLNAMFAVAKESLPMYGSEEVFLKNRNDAWMKKLPGLMKAKSQFIAVGALHLAGPDGLVKQLQQLGYTVTPVKL